jgi:nitric oxide dioxygenase
VKREAAPDVPAGVVSNWLHDQAGPGTRLKAAPPAGDFFLDRGTNGPVVLVSGGVGLTPLISMLETIAATAPERPTWFVHGALNGRVHAMGAHARALTNGHETLHARFFYAEPDAQEPADGQRAETGLITAEWLVANTPREQATYYLCGPKPFLAALVNGLGRQGIPIERIRFEFFGPADELVETPRQAA